MEESEAGSRDRLLKSLLKDSGRRQELGAVRGVSSFTLLMIRDLRKLEMFTVGIQLRRKV